MDEIDEMFGELEDPRTGNAKLKFASRDSPDRSVHGLVRRGRLFGHGLVRALQAGFSGPIPEA